MGETGRSNMISAPVMMQVNETKHLKEVVDSDCVCALLSLASPRSVASSPKSSRSRDSLAETVESRPVKMLKRQDSREQVCRVGGVASSKGVAQPTLQPGAEAMLNRWVELKRGKYKGRSALVVGMTAKKFRVRVTGVELQLEFYPSMFKEIECGSTSPPTPTSQRIQTPLGSSSQRIQTPSGAISQRIQTIVAQSKPIVQSKPSNDVSVAPQPPNSSQTQVITRRLPPQLMRKLQPPQLPRLETSGPKMTCREECTLGEQLVSPIIAAV